MNPPIWHFQDALADAARVGGKHHLLIGAGFSAGGSAAMTSHGLAETMAATPGYADVQHLFLAARSHDVEQVMAYVLHKARVIGTEAANQDARAEVLRLQKFFGKGIARSQFQGVDGSDYEMMGLAACFIAQFSSVFSLNYDLLPYRARLRAEEDRLCSFTDGFGPATDQRLRAMVYEGFYNWSTRSRFYWPHGALFITHDDERTALKLTKESTAFLTDDQLRLLYEFGVPTLTDICLFGYDRIDPLFVAAGSDWEKRVQIARNGYLNEAFAAFGEIGKCLFTHGWSMSDPDRHLIGAIAQNPNLRCLYVGLYGDPGNDENQRIIAITLGLARSAAHPRGPLCIRFYSANSAGVWGKPDDQFVTCRGADARDLPFE